MEGDRRSIGRQDIGKQRSVFALPDLQQTVEYQRANPFVSVFTSDALSNEEIVSLQGQGPICQWSISIITEEVQPKLAAFSSGVVRAEVPEKLLQPRNVGTMIGQALPTRIPD